MLARKQDQTTAPRNPHSRLPFLRQKRGTSVTYHDSCTRMKVSIREAHVSGVTESHVEGSLWSGMGLQNTPVLSGVTEVDVNPVVKVMLMSRKVFTSPAERDVVSVVAGRV